MSKHPIPDWLRSQFSRIEDEVRKLGPCGVFTQMRTVTQTYFEQQAAAPQPPALGGELEVTAWIISDEDGTIDATVRWDVAKHSFGDVTPMISKAAHVSSLAPLQAEIERLKDNVREVTTYRDNAIKKIERLRNELTGTEKERDQLKTRCDELEALLREVAALDPRGEFMGWQLDGRIDAALSKPAGSERVCHLCRGEGRVGGPAPDEGLPRTSHRSAVGAVRRALPEA